MGLFTYFFALLPHFGENLINKTVCFKFQVVLMLQSVLTLDSPERSEAMGFIKDCVTNFGLTIPKEDQTTTIRSSNSFPPTSSEAFTPWMNHLKENYHETESISAKNYFPGNYNFHGSNENEVNVEYEQSSPTDLSKSTWLNYNNNNNSSSSDLLLLESKKKVVEKENETVEVKKEIPKKSRRKQMFTRKSVRRVPVEKEDEKELKVEKAEEVREEEDEKKLAQKKKKKRNDEDEEEGENAVYKCPGCPMICETKPLLLLHFKSHSKAAMSCRMCRLYFSKVLHFWRHQKNGKCQMAKLQCSECGEKFKYRRHYLKHIVGHNDNNCRYCDEKFSTWLHYKNHLKSKHPDIKMERDLIPCKFCPMSFRRHLGLYNHYRVKHSKGKFVCLSCGLLLPTKEKYKEHALVHESEKNWKCKICKMKFYRRQQLLFHVSVHKSGIYKCLTCNITVTSKADLSKHKKDGHEVKGLEPKFECEVCHKTFDKMVRLKNHLATHSGEKKFYCKYCVKYFTTMHALQKHEKRTSHFEKAQVVIPESKYEKVYEDKLMCENCGKLYKTQRELKWHLRVHKNIYECHECGKTFTLKINLTKHIKLHRNPVRVVCELCGDTFNQLSALNEHNLLKHSDVRKEKCEICQKTFKRKSELNRHMRSHGGKRSFVCFCGKAYRQSGHLRHHFKTAHGKTAEQGNILETENYQNETGEIYELDRRKQYVNGEQNNILAVNNLENEQDYRSQAQYDGMEMNEGKGYGNFGLRYPQNEIEPMNVTYEDLNFGNGQSDKRELVFNSPAVDLSMVAISEVVQGGMSLDEGQRGVGEAEENFNKMPDDTSHIQLLNLSEHIVQEYLLNLP